MVGSKDHFEVSTRNIIKLTLKELPADDQQHFEDIMKQDVEETLQQLARQRKHAKEKYLSHFTVDRH
jgi:phage terminase Nu1 subunit (DNA packaging protein)